MQRTYQAFLLLLASPLFGATKYTAIDKIFAPLFDLRAPGAAVLVRQSGHTVFVHGYGVTDLRTSTKITERTNFRLASLSKQFTAMACMQLVHDGKLRYDQSLAETFPGFPTYGHAITVRHLLTHTSGLADYETLMDEKEKAAGPIWSSRKQIRDEEVLALLAQQATGKFAPGTSWAYSNSGYVVLGLIVAKVSRMPYPEFLQRRIFAPLKMSHTIAYVNGQNTVDRRAYGFSNKNGQLQEADQSATSATLGDGGIYSNLLDLARWDAALVSGKLLSKAEMESALTPVKLNDGSEPHWPKADDTGDNLSPGEPVSYGFGWFLNPLAKRTRMWHSGSTSGFRTVIERFPKERLTIVVLANRADLDPTALAEKIAATQPGRLSTAKKRRIVPD